MNHSSGMSPTHFSPSTAWTIGSATTAAPTITGSVTKAIAPTARE